MSPVIQDQALIRIIDTCCRYRCRISVNRDVNREAHSSMPNSAPQINHSMLEAILQSAVGAIITIDTHGIIQTVNPATISLFSYAENEMLGQNVKMLMPDPHRSKHDGYMAHHMATGERKIIGIGRDVEGLRKDGSLFPMHLSVSAFEVQGKRYFAGIVHDLSARSRLEVEISRQTALFQAVFDHVPESLIITDAERKILLVNPAAARVFGYPAAQMTGQSSAVIYDLTSDCETVGTAIENLANGTAEHIQPLAVQFRRRSGESFPGQIVIAMIKGPGGESAGILSLVRDLTLERKQEDARLKTQRLEAIGQLTGGVAHDFNNLLTIIAGNLELLEDYVADPHGLDHLKRAQAATEAGARLTNRLLTFARRRRLEPQIVDLNVQVQSMTELLGRTLGGNIELTTHLKANLWKTRIDSSEIENAILNLAINARDAMPNGGKLVIETSNVVLDGDGGFVDGGVTPGNYVRMSVSDTGIGMSKEVLRRVFEPFFTTKDPGRGTGLGLSTIYGFVKQSNGNVVIYSELGEGTTVNVYLPQYQVAQNASAEQAPELPATAPTNETIFVVEDNPEVRNVAVSRLKRLGYCIEEADNASDAISRLSQGLNVDAVFSDVVMPGQKSGFDLARWTRDNRPELAIILTSGFAEDVMPDAATQDFPILRKPYSQASLASALKAAMSEKRRKPS
jgi:PAS domain S-box-containing protein